MHIIKLNAIDSTNSYLRRLSTEKPIEDYTVVAAKTQTKGRGQMGTHWDSQSSKNLMVSVFRDTSFLDIEQHFFISIVVSLALHKTLQNFAIKNVTIKWPNDILSENKKIAGILIENVIKNNKLIGSVIGVGLNVNQTNFENLPNASSLRLISGQTFNVDEVLHKFLKFLKDYFLMLEQKKYESLSSEYETYLFRKDKPSTFRDVEGSLFSGYIKGVSNSGNLQVLIEDDIIKEFDLKEITLLY
jgi:BirA family biotin operon repressor/biotin-[acetyl-CoA-carboxylase] ligase